MRVREPRRDDFARIQTVHKGGSHVEALVLLVGKKEYLSMIALSYESVMRPESRLVLAESHLLIRLVENCVSYLRSLENNFGSKTVVVKVFIYSLLYLNRSE